MRCALQDVFQTSPLGRAELIEAEGMAGADGCDTNKAAKRSVKETRGWRKAKAPCSDAFQRPILPLHLAATQKLAF